MQNSAVFKWPKAAAMYSQRNNLESIPAETYRRRQQKGIWPKLIKCIFWAYPIGAANNWVFLLK